MEELRVHHGRDLLERVTAIKAGLPSGWQGYVAGWLSRSPDPEVAAFGQRMAAIVEFPEDRPGVTCDFETEVTSDAA
jgi:hypothetical protein